VFPYREIDGSGAMSHAVRFEKPIVASNVGGFAEPPFRDYVELVPPDDATALARVLSDLLDDSARLTSLTDKSRTLRSLLPSWPAFAAACQLMYRGIATRRSDD
jgi:glycosyltransferase involved in cell wall biosynthesis